MSMDVGTAEPVTPGEHLLKTGFQIKLPTPEKEIELRN